jgi:glutaconate CoA-transferase, subunit A
MTDQTNNTFSPNEALKNNQSKIIQSKVISMAQAIERFVNSGDVVVIEGFTHLICFAAGHEIIRQGKKNLTLCRLTPDLIYDQMIAAGCVEKLVFSWAGNPGVGPLNSLRRAVEAGVPHRLLLEEYSHFGMVARFQAGASQLPFMMLDDFQGSDLPGVNPHIRQIQCPYTGKTLNTVPALNPDVTIIHAQRACEDGNTQIWGLMGVQKEACFAAKRVIVVVEELVSDAVIRQDPNRTLIPGMIVDAVVVEPFGAHPSYAQGYYDRDNDFYQRYAEFSKTEASMQAYLKEWVYGVPDRASYVKKLGTQLDALKATPQFCEAVNYGY